MRRCNTAPNTIGGAVTCRPKKEVIRVRNATMEIVDFIDCIDGQDLYMYQCPVCGATAASVSVPVCNKCNIEVA
ncbi:MAG: hypothetical protein JXA98_06995 [Methanosarcinaceae archaeon]|nr:hypothetical protein [Methanosarcinaceae archaeon]